MSIDAKSIIKETKTKMDKSVEIFHQEMATVRSGSASTALVDSMPVEHYGTTMPLNQLAHISTSEGRIIIIQPWDQTALPSIEKAINKSPIGLTPNNDGRLIRIVIPSLSEERRQDLVKVIKKILEDGKVTIRNERRTGIDHLKKLQKEKIITEDELKSEEQALQKLTDGHIAQLTEIYDKKEKDILTV